MLYRINPKNGDKLSQLGYGCMRLPRRGIGFDMPFSTRLIHSAIDAGVNYFDTAYIYPGNEAAMGQILAGGHREKVHLATKMPIFITRQKGDFDKYFARQLDALQTDYIDYYMMHMLTDLASFEKLQKLGLEEWVQKEKARGRIRNIGFSFHGRPQSFKRIVDAYPWEFCMIQYNYIDTQFQAGTEGLRYAHAKGLPVMVMEPLRGGKLVNLPPMAQQAFAQVDPDATPAQWALRWVWNHPEVTLLLSGMNTMEQLEMNVADASLAQANTLTATDLAAYDKALAIIREATRVGCTGCGYCMPCPAGVDIPGAFSNLNELVVLSKSQATRKQFVAAGITAKAMAFASQCKRCGQCEKHCPQNIAIIDMLTQASRELEPFWVRPVASVARLFTQHKESSIF